MEVLPPGTLLQMKYLKERLAEFSVGRFIEVGPGAGEITRLLLALGWSGVSIDLDEITVDSLNSRFCSEVATNRYKAICGDYVSLAKSSEFGAFDLVISCMVMEHLGDHAERDFMTLSAKLLRPRGRMIGLVPSSPADWGIEDEIAGHFRRYTPTKLRALTASTGWELNHLAGLTFPISNLLLPISNYLVSRKESEKLILEAQERTRLSGRREVRYKTTFPAIFRVLLNETTIFPLHIIQKLCARARRCLILYFEAEPM